MNRVQTIKKGKHHTKFRQRFWGIYPTNSEPETFELTLFGDGITYDHANDDQLDWNKLPMGMYFDWYKPHGQTMMLAWRWNDNLKVVQVTPYYHNLRVTTGYKSVGSVPGWFNPKKVMNIRWDGEKAVVTLRRSVVKDLDALVSEFWNEGGDYMTDTASFHKIGAFHTRGSFYFGGNQKSKGYCNCWIQRIG